MLFLSTCSLLAQFGQDLKPLSGVIYSLNGDLEGIHIYNQTQDLGTISDKTGLFVINAKHGDTLRITSVHHEKKTVVLTQEDIGSSEVRMFLKGYIEKLDEVVVRPYLSGILYLDTEKL